jgi:hypothetical protein
MIKPRYITLFATIMLLSSCGAGVTIKDATGFIAGQVITNSGDSDVVSVHDARIKQTPVVVPQQNSKNWNNTSDTVTTTTTTQAPITTPQVRVDKTSTLYWFFFSMMIMGMLGAGIIGIIEAFSGRNSLSTEQAERTAPIIKKPKPKAKPKAKIKHTDPVKNK